MDRRKSALVAIDGAVRRVNARTLANAVPWLRGRTIGVVTVETTEASDLANRNARIQAQLAYFRTAITLYQALGDERSSTTRTAEIARADAAVAIDNGFWP